MYPACYNTRELWQPGTPDTGQITDGHGGGMYPHMLQHSWTVTTRGHRILDKLRKGMEEVCTLHVTTRVNCDNPGHRILDKLRTGMEEVCTLHVTTRVDCDNPGHRILDKLRTGMEEVCTPTCYNTRVLWQHGDTGYWINYGRAWRRYVPHMLQPAWPVTTRGHRILVKLRKGMEEVGTPHVTTRVNCDNTGTPDTG